ncbi:unnamed protein product [Ambrosiozyma monospora]|uniref:Unnamed protein product n=1 Tax=Ambrosiozyma monospora TaxID=43982 RepID=A0A9W6YU80_AMBMO|nr:unnamed protein product [Ambrosiozyma monospora]
MLEMEPQVGLSQFFQYITTHEPDLKFTICTRNLIKPVHHLIQHHLPGVKLSEPVITRAFDPPKPSPKPLLHISKCWGVDPKNIIMIGDSRDDMFAGLRAGCTLILMKHKDNQHLVKEIPQIDYVVEDYIQLLDVLLRGFVIKDKYIDDSRHNYKDIGYYWN